MLSRGRSRGSIIAWRIVSSRSSAISFASRASLCESIPIVPENFKLMGCEGKSFGSGDGMLFSHGLISDWGVHLYGSEFEVVLWSETKVSVLQISNFMFKWVAGV